MKNPYIKPELEVMGLEIFETIAGNSSGDGSWSNGSGNYDDP